MYLTCPKCHNAMQTFQRSGLQIEQCTACRGVFLDYGELERIMQAEASYYQQQYAQPRPPAQPGYGAPAPMPGAPMVGGGYHAHGQYRHHGHHHQGHHRHKSFLGELLG